jgi:Tat protein secretion system quality control protein TatD with DNase activity
MAAYHVGSIVLGFSLTQTFLSIFVRSSLRSLRFYRCIVFALQLQFWIQSRRNCHRKGARSYFIWFTGSKSEAKRAAALGCYFSINAKMLDKPNGRDLVASLPVDRLLTETDAPFTEFNNRSSTPTDATETVRMLGTLKNSTYQDFLAIINANFGHCSMRP